MSDVGPEALQLPLGTLVVLFGTQLVAVKPLPADAGPPEQTATATGPVLFGVQTVVV